MDSRFKDLIELNDADEGVKLDADFHEGNNDIIVVKIEGYIDTKNSQQFMNSLLSVVSANTGASKLVLDLNAVTYISSTGVGSLTNVLVQSKKVNMELYLSNVNEKINNVIKMLGFSSFFKFINSPSDL